MIGIRILLVVIGYCCGLFPTGRLMGRAHDTDLRKVGSGNTGMTNSIRALGWKAGLLVFFGDFIKTVAPMMIVWAVFHGAHPDIVWLLMLYTGVGSILGHNFPFYQKFKGGKGVVCSIGTIIFFDWRLAPICTALFFIAALPTQYVSLGSLSILAGFLVQTIVFGQLGLLHVATEHLLEVYLLAAAMTGLGFFMHRENLKRVANGTESKFRQGRHRNDPPAEEAEHAKQENAGEERDG